MGIVHHNGRVVAIGQFADLRQSGEVTIHGEHAIGGNQSIAATLSGLQLLFEVGHIIIAVAITLSLAQPDAVDDAGMVELIRDDGVLFREQCFEQTAVGIEARAVEDGVIGTEETADPLFQGVVDRLCAADEADGGHTVTPAIECFAGSLHDGRVISQPQIIIGTKIHNLTGIGESDAGVLR